MPISRSDSDSAPRLGIILAAAFILALYGLVVVAIWQDARATSLQRQKERDRYQHFNHKRTSHERR